jgi:hypothetical protein
VKQARGRKENGRARGTVLMERCAEKEGGKGLKRRRRTRKKRKAMTPATYGKSAWNSHER